MPFPSQVQPLELLDEVVLVLEVVEVLEVPQTRWFMLHKEVPGIQHVDAPPVQVGTKLAMLQEAASPFGQIFPDVQL